MTSTFTDLKIAELCRSGALLGEIGRINSDDAEPGSLLNRCVALHNAGQIDLLALTETQQFAELSGPAFFDRQHFFCKAIPFLDATVPTLVQAVQSLVVKGGNDLASSLPMEAFRNWCAADLTRARAGWDRIESQGIPKSGEP